VRAFDVVKSVHGRDSVAEPAPRGADRPAGPVGDSAAGRLVRAVIAAPDRIVLVLFWTSLVVSITVLLGEFTPWLVVPAVLVLVVLTWRLAPYPVGTSRAHTAGAGAAIAAVAVWVGVNVPYASQYVVVTRDPGFLTLEGIWLASHRAADLPLGAAGRVAAAVQGVSVDTDGYSVVGGSIQVQGAKLLPGLLAMASWLGGDKALYAANLIIGAVALLAMYGFARRLLGPLWALVPVVMMATSMPMTAFSRSAYTEPLVMAFVFGGLTMTWSALRERTRWRFVLAGALVGAAALARIDGAAPVIGLVVGLAIAAAATGDDRVRRHRSTGTALAVGAALVCLLLGFLDLLAHSEQYLDGLHGQFLLLALALLGTVVLSLSVLAAPWYRVRAWCRQHDRRIALAAAGVVLLVGAALVTRPLWYVAHHDALDSGVAQAVAQMQRAEGLRLQPTRSYDEMTVTWLSWYYGWLTVALSFAGLALVAYRAVRRHDPRLVVFLTVVATPSVLYLWRISITPDQIWAMRRLLPVTIPGLAIAATQVVASISRWRGGPGRRRVGVLLAGLLVIATAGFPVLTWGHLFGVGEQDGRSAELATACDAVGSDRVVYVSTGGPLYLASLWSMCGVEAVQMAEPPSPDQLTRIKQAWGGGTVAVVTFSVDSVPWEGAVASPLRVSRIETWDRTLSARPRVPLKSSSSLYVGTVQDDGRVLPVDATGAPGHG
jgi:4-amino-4-deoxy-L-arabinose transferase-like glycosyltransferase